MVKWLKHITVCVVLFSSSFLYAGPGDRKTVNMEWFKESPDKSYYYLDFDPSAVDLSAFNQLILSGEWTLEIIGYSSSTSFKARIYRPNNAKTVTRPSLPYSKDWYTRALSGNYLSYEFNGTMEFINTEITRLVNQGYKVKMEASAALTTNRLIIFGQDN